MSEQHEHDQVPANPQDGDRFSCACGYSAEFVVLDDGLPGEWVSVSPPANETPMADTAEEGTCGCPTIANGDMRCHVCGEYVNKRCWNCRTPRGDGPCPSPLT